MKSFAHKLAAITCTIALFAGCASVTDANLAEEPAEDNVEQVTPKPDDVKLGTDMDMSPIYDKPTVDDIEPVE